MLLSMKWAQGWMGWHHSKLAQLKYCLSSPSCQCFPRISEFVSRIRKIGPGTRLQDEGLHVPQGQPWTIL